MASKRGRQGKKAAETEEVVAPEVNVEAVKNGAESKKKPAAKSKAAVSEEAPTKAGRGRKAAPKDDPTPEVAAAPVEDSAVAKKGRGRKAANGAAEVEEVEAPPAKAVSPAKKGKAVENGSSSPAAVKGKGRGKAAPAKEPEVEAAAASAPAGKRGRKTKADTKEPEPELAPSPAKKSKAASKEPSPKKATAPTSPKKAPEPESSEAPAAAKGRGRGKKAAAPAEEKAVSPVKASPKADAAPAKKGGRGKKAAAAESEANGVAPEISKTTTKKASSRSKKSENNDEVIAPSNGVTQRKKKKVEDDLDGNAASSGEPKAKKVKGEKKPAAPKMNKCLTDYTQLKFDLEGKEFNFKISSWNIAGLRSWVDKGGLDYLEHEKPDILCVQETKCTDDQLPEAARQIKGYHPYWLCKPGGYAGVAIYSKKMPLNITYGLGDEEQDADGRILTAEYIKFYLVCVYVPNAGRGLVTLPKRMRWDEKFHAYLKDLDSKKPVILCGDMNVAHEEIDLANPKTNKKNAGFTPEEREGMTKLLSLGFVDTFRQIYPDQKAAYTFWTYMGNARAKNVGWRLDYFITSERLQSKVVDHVIRSGVYGSDHCPITLFLNL